MFSFQASKFLKLAIAGIALASQAAFAAPVSFSGELTASDPKFNRPFTTNALSGAGTNVAYDLYSFHVSANGIYSMETTSFNSSPSDTFLALYQGAFNAASPLANLLTVDDDSGAGSLSLINQALQANNQYFLVVTSYNNNQFGTYTGRFDTVSGGGQVTLGALVVNQVPEPGTLALLPLAALGAALARRRKRA
ncbi:MULTISPECIES: PEP-CTERM sorting domain-containing protein [unclassified Massilia]|uniref:PEP-CTERM sorting domain-containing protein n=1 Tax=unclassified Massilia TaxID=2609279 RepID=UPI00177EF812|nr:MULTISPECIES: PEP-CTERM sorting domain-containing protein [unclassified Massilia]MBD8529598.1 PEP-CTERM sorting domain-containing protein [Massilia sp. CFBP 13647]MBD8673315.1 PEP-CTERM sorting domain-containing protein [Massilia sp. CFBP 13721]